MTDKELIRALRICPKCQLYEYGDCGVDMKEHAANRLEELVAENERLKTGKDVNVSTKWVSVSERLPESNDGFIVVVKSKYDFEKDFDIDVDYAEYVELGGYIDGCWNTVCDWDEGQQYLHVTHWMPLPEPPSTEGVE